KDRLEVSQVVGGQHHLERRDVLLEVLDPRRARDRDDVLALREHPCKRDLSGGAVPRGRDLLDPLDKLQVLLEILALEAWVVATEIALLEIIDGVEPPRKKPAAERAVRDEADAELANRRQDRVLDVAAPERVLGLQGGNRVDRVRPANRFGTSLRQAEVAHLPLLDQLRHGT